MNKYYITREAGVIVRLTRWPTVDTQGDPLPIQERLVEDHPEVIAFFSKSEPQDPYDGLLEALDEFVTNGTRSKLDELLAAKALEQQT